MLDPMDFVRIAPGFVALAALAWSPAPAEADRAPTGIPTSAPAADDDAAARHARRTVCLQEAKARKLVGARRDAFVKECLAGR